MIARIVWSVILIAIYSIAEYVWTPVATLTAGKVAGAQFESSDAAYYVTMYTFGGITLISWAGFAILALLLLWIWWTPLKLGAQKLRDELKGDDDADDDEDPRRSRGSGAAPFVLIGALAMSYLVLAPGNAYAFFEKTERTEAVLIGPNDSAFWIPDVGDNKNSQASMDSEDYYKANKVATKRFLIPHHRLAGSAGTYTMSWDYYVPDGRLILVDRSPYSREWVKADDRGSAKGNQGIVCQSSEGLDITVGLGVGATVKPEDAAKFLYRFGVKKPAGEVRGTADAIENDGRIIFTSVFYGRSLPEVMDDNIRKAIGTITCNQFTARTIDQANKDAVLIMENIRKEALAYTASYGITLEFIGWADTFEFQPEIQAAINRVYIAKADAQMAATLAPYKDLLTILAANQALRDFGSKTDGHLPQTYVGLPLGAPDMLRTFLAPMMTAPGMIPTPPASATPAR